MTDVIVLGGGIVGVTTALALQQRGRDVCIIDQGAARSQSSFGNAGIIQVEAAEPYAMPRSLHELVAIALRHSNAVNWHWNALPRHLWPLWKYFRHSRPSRHRSISSTYAQLTSRATRDHTPLIDAAKAWPLIRRDGFRHAYRNAAQMSVALTRARRLTRDYGVTFTAMDSAALAAAEPGLKIEMAGAIHWRDSWTCADPGALVAAYTALFLRNGGTIFTGDAMTLERRGDRWLVDLTTPSGQIAARDAVISIGFQSAHLCRRFGLDIPLFRKRGYHCHFETTAGPDLLLVDVENSAVLAPMRAGLRILTGAEIAQAPTAPTPVQLTRATQAARRLFEIGRPLDRAPWVGNRPCMPDMLPVVGAVPGQSGLWANFGHGHQGFTLGPTTAALLGDEMTGAPVAFAAMSPGRRF